MSSSNSLFQVSRLMAAHLRQSGCCSNERITSVRDMSVVLCVCVCDSIATV